MAETQGAIVRSLSRDWHRGPARLERGAIVLDLKRSTVYQPLSEPKVGFELAKVRTPADAVRFVERYGLLEHGAADPAFKRSADSKLSEPFVAFERAAADIRLIVHTIANVREAVKGNRECAQRLRAQFGPVSREWGDTEVVVKTPSGLARVFRNRDLISEDVFADVDEQTVLVRASDWVARGLTDGLLNARSWPYVFEPNQMLEAESSQPGYLRVGILPETLLGVCYLSIAQQLSADKRLGICEECQVPFGIEHGHQRFCSDACANRNRFRRFKERNPGQRPPDTQTDTLARGRQQKTRTRAETKPAKYRTKRRRGTPADAKR